MLSKEAQTMSGFKEIKPEELAGNVFDMIGKKWMLVTAGPRSGFNTMTASWGGLGILWGKPVSFTFVRPQRYTLGFMEKHTYYTLSFYDEKYRDALSFCGSHSGRDTDKIKATGLTPAADGDAVYFSEASAVLVCRKLYVQDLSPASFAENELSKYYTQKDYHREYIGEIEKVLIK